MRSVSLNLPLRPLPSKFTEKFVVARQLFTQDALPYLVRHLRSFIPPYKALPTSVPPSLVRTLVEVDYDALEESCGILESMAMDNEEVRLSLARGINFPEEHGGIPCLADMLAFVDRGDYPPYWSDDPERASYEKGFDRCKAATIKSIVELAGEEKNTDVLWDDSDATKPGGVFIDTMVQWIRKHKSLKETERDDLIICATLSIGNLVRHGQASSSRSPPPSLTILIPQSHTPPPSSASPLRSRRSSRRCSSQTRTSR